MGPLGLLQALASQRNLREGGAFWGGGGPYEGSLGPWSTLVIDGKIFPGADSYRDGSAGDLGGGFAACAVEIDEGAIKYRRDNQRAQGKRGSKKVVHGYEPAQFTAKALIYTEAQWIAFQAYLPTIHPKNKPDKLHVYKVQHPVLQAYSISQVHIHEVSFPRDGADRMIKVVTLHFEEVYDLKGSAKTLKQANVEVGAGVNVIQEARFEEGPRLTSE